MTAVSLLILVIVVAFVGYCLMQPPRRIGRFTKAELKSFEEERARMRAEHESTVRALTEIENLRELKRK